MASRISHTDIYLRGAKRTASLTFHSVSLSTEKRLLASLDPEEILETKKQKESLTGKLIEAVASFPACRDQHAVCSLFESTAREAGVRCSFSGILGGENANHSRAKLGFDSTLENGVKWTEYVRANRRLLQDPVFEMSLWKEEPYDWAEARAGLTPKSPGQRIFREAKTFGLEDGIAVPVPAFLEGKGVVAMMGGKRFLKDLTTAERHWLCVFAREAFQAYMRFEEKAEPEKMPAYDERQRTLLRWLIDDEHYKQEYIALKLGVDISTVRKRASAIYKLTGVDNRLSLVAKFARKGWSVGSLPRSESETR